MSQSTPVSSRRISLSAVIASRMRSSGVGAGVFSEAGIVSRSTSLTLNFCAPKAAVDEIATMPPRAARLVILIMFLLSVRTGFSQPAFKISVENPEQHPWRTDSRRVRTCRETGPRCLSPHGLWTLARPPAIFSRSEPRRQTRPSKPFSLKGFSHRRPSPPSVGQSCQGSVRSISVRALTPTDTLNCFAEIVKHCPSGQTACVRPTVAT